jgi:hypothetical protein
MTVTENDWQELESPHSTPGRSSRLLYPDAPLEVLLAVSYPSRERMLVLRAGTDAVDHVVRAVGRLRRTAGIELQLSALSRLEYELQVVLTAGDLREVFNPLVTDVAETARAAETPKEALMATVDRFERWQELLRSVGRDGLRAEARRGLYGELVVLERVLDALPEVTAVESWTGPTGTDQDFQLPRLAIEVKSSAAKQPRSIRVASERQLDDSGVPRLLLCLAVLDERRGGSGESLNARVRSLRERLTQAPARARLDRLLIQGGYLPSHQGLYDEPRYMLRETCFWQVREGFPRLAGSDLPEGVSECTYQVTLTGLDAYRVPDEEVKRLMGESDE